MRPGESAGCPSARQNTSFEETSASHGAYLVNRHRVDSPVEQAISCAYLRTTEQRREIGWLVGLPALARCFLESSLDDRLYMRCGLSHILSSAPVSHRDGEGDDQILTIPSQDSLCHDVILDQVVRGRVRLVAAAPALARRRVRSSEEPEA